MTPVPGRRIWGAVTAWALGIPIRVKIMGIVLGVVFLFGAVVALQTRAAQEEALSAELNRRALSIARDLAARSVDPLLTNHVVALHDLVQDTSHNNEDVRYVFVLDPAGVVVAHTFGSGFPRDLIGVNAPTAGGEPRVRVLESEEGPVHDAAAPILRGIAGSVRVGLTERSLQGLLRRSTLQILSATAAVSLVGVVAAYLLTALLTQPLRELVGVTRAVAAGDLGRQAVVRSRDEFGALARAFSEMTGQLLRRDRELKEKERIRAELLNQVITAQEAERKRIARELHDETGQALTSLLIGLKALEGAGADAEMREKLAEMRALAAQTLEEVHDLAVQLRPSVLDDLGLVPALQRYVRDYARKHHVSADIEVRGFDGRRLAPEIETAIYRIVQEALTNAAKHAGARNVSVVLEHRGRDVAAIVEDDGRGFDVAATLSAPRAEGHLGLYGMEERATLVGGRLEIESAPGAGTTVFVTVPAPPEG